MSATLITSRDPRGLHAVGLFEAAYNKSNLDDARARRLNERGGELQDGVAKLIAELSVSDRYADEEVKSDYAYPKEYKGPKSISRQVDALAKIFGLSLGLTSEYIEKVLPTLTLPDGAEGWFAITSVDALAKRFFPEVKDPAERYCRAVQLVHAKIADSRSFCEGQITPEHLRVHARTTQALNLISETQPGNIMIVAAQLGLRHRGRSVRRAREVFAANEFGLGSLAVGSIVLTHPKRLVRLGELDMDCAGDEFTLDAAAGRFDGAPFFDFRDGWVRFDAGWVGNASDGYGSVSAFRPQ